jgi:hypothetical protein
MIESRPINKSLVIAVQSDIVFQRPEVAAPKCADNSLNVPLILVI